MSQAKYLRLYALLLLCFTSATFALQEDSKEKLYINADTTQYNYKTGFTIYEGHVKADQGSTHITADRLTTKANKLHTIDEVIAYGIQGFAQYRTLPKPGDPELIATAKIIKFYPISSNSTLEKQVVVTQGENSFKGELILYNRNDQTIIVPEANAGQAVVVYDPDKPT